MIIAELPHTKINIQTTVAFLYTKNKHVDFDIENTIPCTLASGKNKRLNKWRECYMSMDRKTQYH